MGPRSGDPRPRHKHPVSSDFAFTYQQDNESGNKVQRVSQNQDTPVPSEFSRDGNAGDTCADHNNVELRVTQCFSLPPPPRAPPPMKCPAECQHKFRAERIASILH